MNTTNGGYLIMFHEECSHVHVGVQVIILS